MGLCWRTQICYLTRFDEILTRLDHKSQTRMAVWKDCWPYRRCFDNLTRLIDVYLNKKGAMVDSANLNQDGIRSSSRQVGVSGWPAKFPERLLTIRTDTREQLPWTFASCYGHFGIVRGTVRHGDYVLDVDPLLAAVERKSLPDFVRCCGTDRERFFKQIAGLKGATQFPLLIIEADYGMLEVGGGWRGKMTPEQVLAVLHKVQNQIPVLLCRSRDEAERGCFRHLRLALKHRYEKCREFARAFQA